MGAQVSRQPPPPLPGGYFTGRGKTMVYFTAYFIVYFMVYFTGKGKTFKNGDRLEHGKQGEVVGPATSKSHKGKGVAVLFPGNKGAIICLLKGVGGLLDQVRRGRRHAATHSSPPAPTAPPPHPTYGVWRVGVQVSRQPPPAAKEEGV